MPVVSTPVRPDWGFYADVEGETRCQREGSFGRRHLPSIFAPKWGWSASRGFKLRVLAPDSVAWKLRQDKDSLARRLRGVVVDCAGRPPCGSGSCGTCRWLRCQCGGHQVQHSHPHVVPWHRSGKGKDAAPRSEGEDEAEIASLEDMMGNALKAAQCRTVKQCVFKSEVEGRQEGEGELPRGGQARPGGQP